MGADDCGYDFIWNLTDDEVKLAYTSRLEYAMELCKKRKPEDALGYIKDALYYSGELKKRKIRHKVPKYDKIVRDISDMLYDMLDR